MSVEVASLVWREQMSTAYKLRLRKAVLAKSRGKCWYCGDPLVLQPHTAPNVMSVDHVIPAIRGGGSELSNLVPTCRSCNSTKRDRSIEELRQLVLRKREGWPYFSAEQLAWLKCHGFLFPTVPPVVFWFEGERL